MKEPLFSILIPSWNNLAFLKLCVESIRKNSTYEHELLIHVNDGSDGTLEWVKAEGLKYTHSPENIGVCYALNGLRPLVTTDYVLFMNDDMYVLPGWDAALYDEIQAIGHQMFFLSATLIQPRKFFCKSVIAPANYGESIETFEEQRLLGLRISCTVTCGTAWVAIVSSTALVCTAIPTSRRSSGMRACDSSRVSTRAGCITSRHALLTGS